MNLTSKKVCDNMPKELRVTWSGLKRHKRCAMSQHLVATGHRSRTKDGRIFLKGNLCDLAQRRWLENGDFSVPIEKYLKDVWVENTGPNAEYPIKWKSDTDQQDIVDSAREALVVLEEVLREKVIPFRFEPEMRFTSYVGIPDLSGEIVQVALFGAIDVAVMYPDDTIGLWDLKLSENRGYITSSIGQLVLYDLAVHNWLGVRPSEHGFFTPMLPKEAVIPVTVTDEDRKEMVSDIISYAHSVWNNEKTMTEDENDCFFCETRHACPRFHKPLPKSTKRANFERFGQR